MQMLAGLLAISYATAAWVDSPRYSADFADGARSARCIPCNVGRSDQSNNIDYRGNGADNLGYDWSPRAWGGPAFPAKDKSREGWTEREGRRMSGRWDDMCRDCGRWEWSRFTERPEDRNKHTGDPVNGWMVSTDNPRPWRGGSEPSENSVTTVTSSVLGVRLHDDKRLPVEWSGSRSMRWDGFRNGMPWDHTDPMAGRNVNDPRWDETSRGAVGWDQDGKGHYASDWSYGSRDPAGSGIKWNDGRPWMQSQDRNGAAYGQGGGDLPFGGVYPNSDRFPSTSTWRPTTTSYLTKPFYNYPTNNRPKYSYYTDKITGRPYPTNSWTTPSPNQNYLPQSNGPSSKPEYEYQNQRPNIPYEATPGTAIWNGRPDTKYPSGGHSPKPPQGFYTGFITEIHDPNFSAGNGYPSDRPSTLGGNSYQDRYPDTRPISGGSSYQDRYPSSKPIPTGTSYPDRYPSSRPISGGGSYQDRYPAGRPQFSGDSSYPDRYPIDRPSISGGGSYQERYPNNDRFPTNFDKNSPFGNRPSYPTSYQEQQPLKPEKPYGDNRIPSYDSDRNRFPGPGRYPENYGDKDRYPSQGSYSGYGTDRNRYPDQDRYPAYNADRNRYPSQDRYPGYDADRNRYNYPDYDNNRNQYGNDRDRNPTYGGHIDSNRYPGYGNDKGPPSRPIGFNTNRDRPPGSSSDNDRDRGPNPSVDSGSWNYGEETSKDGTYRRSGGSYPPYKGGQYFTSSYLASASTPLATSEELKNKKNGNSDETTESSQEK